MSLSAIRRDLSALGHPEKAAFFPRFFKTGKGEYGEGDVFWGVAVPQIRSVAKTYASKTSLKEIEALLCDPVHEVRYVALEMLVMQYEKADPSQKKKIVDFYLSHLQGVNNWDLVDGSAPYILGDSLIGKSAAILDRMVKRKNLWERRVAMVSTWMLIRAGQLEPTFRLATQLLKDPHDLMHKAVGWMLREAGKVDEKALRKFLDTHAGVMPRTMLRYAIEKFPMEERRRYLAVPRGSSITPRTAASF